MAVHRERYVIKSPDGEYDAEITGNLRFSAESSSDFPVVGDWITFSVFDGSLAIIYSILPRLSILERQAVGKSGEKQLIAANVDYSFIVQSLDQDFNINRLERYLTLSLTSDITPILLLSKTDLIDKKELSNKIDTIHKRHSGLRILHFSNNTKEGYEEIENELQKGKTYCFLGSSGVGKSTLINHLLGEQMMKTRTISESTGKGKHTTSHRQLFILKNGSIVIDTPGMREVGVIDTSEDSFDTISELSVKCKFSDCSHTNELGCEVLAAIDDGRIDEASYQNFMKLQREAAHFQSTLAEKRQKDKKFGKIYKQIIAYKKKNK